jgi:hypothetical protein
VEPGAGDEHHAADSGGRRSAARFGDALDGKSGRLRLAGATFELCRRGDLRIQQIEIGKFPRQQRRVGEPDIFVGGRNARHGDGALCQFGDAIAADIVGRHHGLTLPHQHAQPDIVAFRPLRFLDASVAHLDALRNASHGDRIGGVGAGAPRRFDQALRQRAQGGLVEQIGARGLR